MKIRGAQQFGLHLSIGCLLWALSAAGQQIPDAPEFPSQFKLDMDTAARLRPQFMAQTTDPGERYSTAGLVLQHLVEQLAPESSLKIHWQMRIVRDAQLNAFSSPDGTIYVATGLANLAGQSAGLWAAILSHEIAHVVRRDWARRYLYEKYLENGKGGAILLGDPSLPSASWSDSEKASADLRRFCRQMELEADREGLILMARAGYHPDFVPALHHLLHARGSGPNNASIYAMHPCWEERDRELSRAYVEASIAFEHRWPESYASPGGNPPVVVFADQPTVKKIGARQWQLRVPLRCQNLAGAVEVVLRSDPGRQERRGLDRLPDIPESDGIGHQLTGCTSPKASVTFTLDDSESPESGGAQWTDVYIVDAWGAVLARADLPKIPR
ncbi:MAG: M48 family metalloprotease [Candidatus Sulfotelmatobacter sp.]